MEDLVASGVELMLLGMGAVFIFLSLLVVATSTMSRVVMRIAKEETGVGTNSAGQAVGASSPVGAVDDEVVAAISVAVKKYRSRH